MKAFITKYALTKGIKEITVDHPEDGIIQDKSERYPMYYQPGEWHRTIGEAREKAEAMRLQQIEALEKKLKKLRSLDFV